MNLPDSKSLEQERGKDRSLGHNMSKYIFLICRTNILLNYIHLLDMPGRMAELVETDTYQGDRWKAQNYHMGMNDQVDTADLITNNK